MNNNMEISYQQKYEALLVITDMLIGSTASTSDFSPEWDEDLLAKAKLIEDDIRNSEWIGSLVPGCEPHRCRDFVDIDENYVQCKKCGEIRGVETWTIKF